ncbi:hypothetical protein R1flu_005896 [Riccia fluitans]|uniref:Inositol polyphosphate-related phosphatase domain-containing protein n=1 Tax=Riccia fluitans TaxID=41844 RepID=A0ABD1YYG8_9MARC
MAGTRSPSSGQTTPLKISPRESIDDSFDLLTGLYPPVASSPLVVDASGGRNGFGAPGGASSSISPAQLNPNSVVENFMMHNPMQQQQEPMDLLTGFLPPSASPPLNLVVPADVAGKQDAWKRDSQGISAGGGSSTEYFPTSPISFNHPFMENVLNTSASYTVSPPFRAIPSVSDAAMEASSQGYRNLSRSMDGSIPKLNSVPNNLSNLDLGSRSHSSASAGPLPSPSPHNRSHRSNSSGGTMKHTNSFNNSFNNHISGGFVDNSYRADSSHRTEPTSKQSALPSGIGPERLQQSPYPRAETPRISTPPDVNSNPPVRPAPSIPVYQNDNARRNTSDPKAYQRAPSLNINSRNLGKEPVSVDTRTSGSGFRTTGLDEEFVGASSVDPIYRAPKRGAVHPSRPVSLELRPHPLRGAPPNPVTLLTCFSSYVWAACELGIMIWDVENATGRGSAGTRIGDEDAATYEFLRLPGSTTTSMIADAANMVVWTGHRDGKIRLWSARPSAELDLSAKRELRSPSLVFQAHRRAVTALIITSYGELWAGFDNGELKAWPWEILAKAMSGVGDGASHMEKAYVEPRVRNVGVGPNGPVSPEVRFLVSDHASGRVWCGGAQYIALWDAKTRDLIRMFGGPSGQVDLTSVDAGLPGKEILSDEDLKLGYAKVGKKEKGGWLQRSRNAVMGAADAVRRAASGGGQSSDDGRRLEALVAAADGTMWGGYGSGLLVQWDWQGNRLYCAPSRNVVIRSLCAVGNRLWVGYADGKVQVLLCENGARHQVGSWQAHRLSVIELVVCDDYVFSLGGNGSIRGWSITSPDCNLDGIMKATMSNRADSYTCQRSLRVLAGTWNTAQEKASLHTIRTWLGIDPRSSQPPEASIVVVGLQEVEMGAGAIGMAAVKETVGMGLQDKGSQTGQWWLGQIDNSLGEGKDYERIGSRQLAGVLVGVWVRRDLLPYVGEVEAGAVACGFGRAFGNKGAVGVKMMIYRRTICVLTSHLAAHMEQVSRRNADFEHIYNQMSFGRSSRLNATVVSNAVQNMLRGGNNRRNMTEQEFDKDGPLSPDSDPTTDDAPELADADLLIWSGDLNYRIDNMSYEETVSLIRNKAYDVLLSSDQLRLEMANGRTFHGMREGPIKFPPTYKFDKGYHEYDTSEKRRIPAWCDRVLFRDSFDYSDPSPGIKLTRPLKATVERYESVGEIHDSDHKPVRCQLKVDLSVIDETARRREYGEVMRDPNIRSRLAALGYIPDCSVNTNRVSVDDVDRSSLILTNTDRQHRILYVVHCEALPSRGPCPCGEHNIKNLSPRDSAFRDQLPRAGFGFPDWLTVSPAAGVVRPSESAAIRITDVVRPVGSDQQDKVVVLVIRWKGSLSSGFKQHRVCVCRGTSVWSTLKEKESQNVRSYEQRRPSSRERESQPYAARQAYASSSLTHIGELVHLSDDVDCNQHSDYQEQYLLTDNVLFFTNKIQRTEWLESGVHEIMYIFSDLVGRG